MAGNQTQLEPTFRKGTKPTVSVEAGVSLDPKLPNPRHPPRSPKPSDPLCTSTHAWKTIFPDPKLVPPLSLSVHVIQPKIAKFVGLQSTGS